jgi:hypothetical protein
MAKAIAGSGDRARIWSPFFDITTLRFAGQFDPVDFFQINLIQINASAQITIHMADGGVSPVMLASLRATKHKFRCALYSCKCNDCCQNVSQSGNRIRRCCSLSRVLDSYTSVVDVSGVRFSPRSAANNRVARNARRQSS